MMEFSVEAWNDRTLKPLEKLIWLRCTDWGMDQESTIALDDWLTWTGCESPRELMDAMFTLYDLGYFVEISIAVGEGIYLRTKFAPEQEAREQPEYSTYKKQPIPAELRQAVFDRDGHTCVYCGDTEGPFQADHVYPESLGGEATMENLACACKPCNVSKGSKTLEEWNGRAQ